MSCNKNIALDVNVVFSHYPYLHSKKSKNWRLQELDEPVKLGQHVHCQLLIISDMIMIVMMMAMIMIVMMMTMIMIVMMMTLTWSPMSLTMSPA